MKTTILGRFDFDPARASLTDRVSGRSIRYASTLDRFTNPDRGARHLFEYVGPEGVYPLIVDWPSHFHLKKYREFQLPTSNVDHRASLEYWRNSSGTQAIHPLRDTWILIDEFSAQAFACWPEWDVTGPTVRFCARHGGWLADAWHDSVVRLLGVDTRRHVQGIRIDDGPNLASMQSTSSWEACNTDARPLSNDERLDEVFAERFLDSGALPGEMAEEMLRGHPYFRRTDGKAIILICRRIVWGRQEPGFPPSLSPVLQYCDEDIWLQYHGCEPASPRLQSIWHPKLPRGSRFTSMDGILIQEGRDYYAPSALLWERTSSAFMNLYGLTHQTETVTIKGGFIAGEWLPEAHFQIRRTSDPTMTHPFQVGLHAGHRSDT